MVSPTIIKKITLKNFRNFEFREFEFDSSQTVIWGENGKGKTNILEAIYLLSLGKSFRTHVLSECVRLDQEATHIQIQAVIDDEYDDLSINFLSKSKDTLSRSINQYSHNGVKRRKSLIVGILKTVLFRPEDVEIITGGPSFKRNFLDEILIQVNSSYAHSLKEYDRALRHRNKLIMMLRDGGASRSDFFIWDELLIKHGDILTRERGRFVHFINDSVSFPIHGSLQYSHSLMTQERLHQYAIAEVGAGKTLVGPHRDSLDIELELNAGQIPRSVELYGSRGQQRLAVLWLKIAALEFIQHETNIAPVLLLDDMFSELDEQNRRILFPFFGDHQVIMTTAEPLRVLPQECRKGSQISLL